MVLPGQHFLHHPSRSQCTVGGPMLLRLRVCQSPKRIHPRASTKAAGNVYGSKRRICYPNSCRRCGSPVPTPYYLRICLLANCCRLRDVLHLFCGGIGICRQPWAKEETNRQQGPTGLISENRTPEATATENRGRHIEATKFHPRITVLALYVIIVNAISITDDRLADHNYLTVARQLAHDCNAYHGVGVSDTPHGLQQGLRYITWVFSALLIAAGCFSVILTHSTWFLKLNIRKRTQRLVTGRFIGLLAAFWAVMILLLACFTVSLQLARRGMKKAVGGAFQDNDWGFGQVIALFIWAPFVMVPVGAVYSTLCLVCGHATPFDTPADAESSIEYCYNKFILDPVHEWEKKRAQPNA